MKTSLLILAGPDQGRALTIADALARRGELSRLFFMSRGVEQLNTNALPAKGDNLATQWSRLIAAHGLDAIACVTSALNAGVLDESQARKFERHATLAHGAELGGLGQLVDMLEQDKVVTLK